MFLFSQICASAHLIWNKIIWVEKKCVRDVKSSLAHSAQSLGFQKAAIQAQTVVETPCFPNEAMLWLMSSLSIKSPHLGATPLQRACLLPSFNMVWHLTPRFCSWSHLLIFAEETMSQCFLEDPQSFHSVSNSRIIDLCYQLQNNKDLCTAATPPTYTICVCGYVFRLGIRNQRTV